MSSIEFTKDWLNNIWEKKALAKKTLNGDIYECNEHVKKCGVPKSCQSHFTMSINDTYSSIEVGQA
jgi:hypothetical protein